MSEAVISGRGIILFSGSLFVFSQVHTVNIRCFCDKKKMTAVNTHCMSFFHSYLRRREEPHGPPGQRMGSGGRVGGQGWGRAGRPVPHACPRPEPALESDEGQEGGGGEHRFWGQTHLLSM